VGSKQSSKSVRSCDPYYRSLSQSTRSIVETSIWTQLIITQRLHFLVQSHIWAIVAVSHEALVNLAVSELLKAAIDAGIGSEKAECAADILVSLNSTAVRGRIVAKLRKVGGSFLTMSFCVPNIHQTIAQTYLKPSKSLVDSVSWNEICVLTRMNLMIAFAPQSALDAQLFLPELVHVITILLGSGPVFMRQTIYGLLVSLVHSLASAPIAGETNNLAIQVLAKRLRASAVVQAFGVSQSSGGLELSGVAQKNESDAGLLEAVESVASFLGELLEAAASSIGM